MNLKLLVGIIIALFVGAILIGAGVFFLMRPEVQIPDAGTQLPNSGSSLFPTVTSTSTSIQQPQMMTVGRQNGTPLAVKDFIHDGAVADPANRGIYVMAGSREYCERLAEKCESAQNDEFLMYYNTAPQSFTIVLTEEPIGKARRDAEAFLQKKLGIGEADMCDLNYYLGVTIYVSEQYTGKNLGFSFCPGATPLPE